MNQLLLGALAFKTDPKQLAAGLTHEYSLGGGIVLSNRVAVPDVDGFPFGVRYDPTRANRELKSNILQTTLYDYDLAALVNSGLKNPRYLQINVEFQILVFDRPLSSQSPGFHLHSGILIYVDRWNRAIVPTFETIMYMITIASHLPNALRMSAQASADRDLLKTILRYNDPDRPLYYFWDPALVLPPDKYTPQMGEISKTCQAATLAAANTCQQELARWPIFDVSVAKAQLLKMSSYLEKECDFVAIIFVCSMSYIAYRILSNLALLGTWMLGYATCAIGARQPQQFYTSKYSPQAGMLSSDDGAAFTGVKPKKATAASKTPKKVVPSAQSTPGVTMLEKSYSSSFGGPPKSKKDPRLQDGFINGFGVGI